jgi:tetratricopeptide (TPR) repeat protein
VEEAQRLFKEGVSAIRDQKDMAAGQKLLMQSLRLHPNNDIAWLWLTRTFQDPKRQLECVERALKLNPSNAQALALRAKLTGAASAPLTTQDMPNTQTAAPSSASGEMPAVQSPSKTSGSIRKLSTQNLPATPSAPSSAAAMGAVVGGSAATSAFAAGTEYESLDTYLEYEQGGQPKGGGGFFDDVADEPIETEVRSTQTYSLFEDDVPAAPSSNALKRNTSTAESAKPKSKRNTGTLAALGGAAAATAAASAVVSKLSASEKRRIDALMAEADQYLKDSRTEDAIGAWVRVLEIDTENEAALRNATRYLIQLDYRDDAKQLMYQAIERGSQMPAVYLTAIDLETRAGNIAIANDVRRQYVQLPHIPDDAVLAQIEAMVNLGDYATARDTLLPVAEARTKSQKIQVRMGELFKETYQEKESAVYFDRAAKLGGWGKEAGKARKGLELAPAIITDVERGSVPLALREALGPTVFFAMLALQDVGWLVGQVGPQRLFGVAVSFVASYLVVTATSGAQQQPLAKWFGGEVPSGQVDKDIEGIIYEETQLPILPTPSRWLLGVGGLALAGLAFWLVFNASIRAVLNPEPVYVPEFCNIMFRLVGSAGETASIRELMQYIGRCAGY